MTTLPLIPCIAQDALAHCMELPSATYSCARDMPPWLDACATYDVDGVLTLLVYALRPGRKPDESHRHLVDQLSMLGWEQVAWGDIDHLGSRAGTMQYAYAAEWSQWRRREVSK